MRNRLNGKQNPHTRNERDRCRGRRGRLRRRRSTQFSPRRQWRRRGAAGEMEEKGGSDLRASATAGLTEYWEAGTEEAFARGGTVEGDGNFQAMAAAENGVEGEGCGRRCWAWTQGRRRRRVCQEIGKEGGGGSASAASRRKQRRRPRSMAATASWEAGTGGLMKTETRPMATEKSEGREDPHVVGDGKEEEGERDSGGDEVRRGSGDSITEEKGGGVCGDGREGREGGGRWWRKREEREKRQGGSPVEERERREEKPGLTASRGRSRGRRQRSASKNGAAGARRDNGRRDGASSSD